MQIIIFGKIFEKFVSGLEKPTIAKVLRTIDLLEKFGFNLKHPHSKKIKENLFELRIRGKQEVRIFYTFHKAKIMLLSGFVKKSQKIPSKEIAKALDIVKQLG